MYSSKCWPLPSYAACDLHDFRYAGCPSFETVRFPAVALVLRCLRAAAGIYAEMGFNFGIFIQGMLGCGCKDEWSLSFIKKSC